MAKKKERDKEQTSEPAKKKLNPFIIMFALGLLLLLFVIAVYIVAGFGIAAMLIIGFIGASIVYLGYKFVKDWKPKGTLSLHEMAYEKIMRDLDLGRLAVPFELEVKHHPNQYAGGHYPGKIIAIKHLPADDAYFNLVKEGKMWKGKKNKVWALRMRPSGGSFFKRIPDEVVIVCDSQVSRWSRDATGNFMPNEIARVYGSWASFGLFKILFNHSVNLSRGISTVTTMQVLEALRIDQDRLAEAVESGAKTHPEIANQQESRRRKLDAD